ncbi:TonB-dependent vitamin B12 receptor [Halomonas cibimaris]|uniref:TonB-dependent vitamin B12 receptor n=1 Tax=Halomonas cibimaris TaxID=657012 RepID=A0ABP7LUV8_9GAMM
MSNRLFLSNRFSAGKTLVPFALAALPLAVSAQTPPASEPADQAAVASLNPVVVTATRAPRTADETLSSVTVLDEATLRRQDPADVTDLLRGQPGVNVSSNGGFGKTTGVSIRGAGNSGTLLMIDGIRLHSATAGGASWQLLDPRMFERAEVVRGPKGSLYGADAMGGVVQLFTPKGDGKPTPSVTLSGGSLDTRRASASFSGSDGATRYHVAASRFDTDGIKLREGGEKKSYDNTSALVRLSQRLGEGAEVGLLALRARGNTEYIGGEQDFVQQVGGVYGEVALGEHWTSRLTLSESRDEMEDFSSFPGEFNTQTRVARLDNTLSIGRHQLIVGAEYLEDKVDSTTAYNADSRDNKAVFAQGLLDFAPFTLQPSLRFDDNEAYGDEVTGSLALGYDLDDAHTLRASYATAFRAPTFNDLYYPGANNPDVEAETAKTYELGARGQYGSWYWDAAIYQSDIDDKIVFVTRPENVDKARIRGVELAGGVSMSGWDIQAALAYTDPEDRATGNRLAREVTQSARLDVDRTLGEWTLGGSLVAEDHRYNGGANDKRLGGYGKLDLRTTWRFAPAWFARVNVDNVFDKDYVTAFDSFQGFAYENPGRSVMLSVGIDGR